MRALLPSALLALAAAVLSCRPSAPAVGRAAGGPDDTHPRLPTGARLDPAGSSAAVGQMPLAMTLSPDGKRVVLLLSGWREQGLQVVDRASNRVVQTLAQPSAFVGLAFSPDGRSVYTSGGNGNLVYRYDWRGDTAVLADSIPLGAHPAPHREGNRYPAGLAVSRDGGRLYVAENLADSLAVIDLADERVVQRVATERYPYAVAVGPDGAVYVSAWGGSTVSAFAPASGDTLGAEVCITVGRHPSAMLLDPTGSRLFVASASTDRVSVVDTRRRVVIGELRDPPPAGPDEGSTPNALALSPDGTRLYVAEADANAVAVFTLDARTAGVAAAGTDSLAGRIPVEWYPTALAVAGDTLLVANGKGRGTASNLTGPNPVHPGSQIPMEYTLGQLAGTLTTVTGVPLPTSALALLTTRAVRANGWDTTRVARAPRHYPPFRHVIYIIKENRTYDQVLGDLRQADGDSTLVFFPRPVSPNHHALVERFGIFDRFFTNAEVSADGHNWSTAAYASDYVEKTVGSQYSGRRAYYDYEGTNRGRIADDDVNEPTNGYLWNLAQRAGITFRNYGEFVVPERERGDGDIPESYRGTKAFLAAHTDSAYPGFDLDIPDQHRVDVWLDEFHRFERSGNLPALELVRLPNDHTSGARAGAPTPRAAMADNDLALGRMIEALSRSRFWPSTVVFVLEDDAQNGPDHVDSHRSVLLVISAYGRRGVIHRFVNTTDVIATIADILRLGSLSQFDHFGRPLREVFADRPDLTPYAALTPSASLDERNPARGPGASASARLDLRFEDQSDDDLFNRILWRAVKGRVPYPGATRISGEALRGLQRY